MKSGLEFMKTCDYCKGTGTKTILPNGTEIEPYDCPLCDGNGDILTEIGKSLLEFVRSKLYKSEMGK